MNFLFVDVETNGFGRSGQPKNKWNRIISLAWALCDENGTPISYSHDLVRPDGWFIPADKFWLDNGFNTKQNYQVGLPIGLVLDNYLAAAKKASLVIGHNITFDGRIIDGELILLGLTSPDLIKVCTMTSSRNVCQIPNKDGRGYKQPKLTELYRFLFNQDFVGAHDALSDVTACSDCFFELLKRGHIELPVMI